MMYMVQPQPPAATDTQWYNGHMVHRTHTDASSYNGAYIYIYIYYSFICFLLNIV